MRLVSKDDEQNWLLGFVETLFHDTK